MSINDPALRGGIEELAKSEGIRDFIFSVLYKLKSCFGIQSFLLLSFACAVQYSRWTPQYVSTVIGSQNIFFVPYFWPLAFMGVRMCLRLLWHALSDQCAIVFTCIHVYEAYDQTCYSHSVISTRNRKLLTSFVPGKSR